MRDQKRADLGAHPVGSPITAAHAAAEPIEDARNFIVIVKHVRPYLLLRLSSPPIKDSHRVCPDPNPVAAARSALPLRLYSTHLPYDEYDANPPCRETRTKKEEENPHCSYTRVSYSS